MLVKLTPEQVAQFWEGISNGVATALPPYVGDPSERMENILMDIMSGQMDCWASYVRQSDGRLQVGGVVLTSMISDPLSGVRNLLIYAVYGEGTAMRDEWKAGYDTLREYAKAGKCQSIIGYTKVPEIVNMVKLLGGNTDYRFVQLPID